MCGIAGFSGNFDSDLLARMGAVIAHRGPDSAGQELFSIGEESVGLAHRRLAIIDLSPAGHQPMQLDCPCCPGGNAAASKDRLWISYNGELYNFAELKKDLESKGHRFHSRTDTEVILHLYATEGLASLNRLNGIFAFALYDGRSQGQKSGIEKGDLILVRDGVGVKPLYYAQTTAGLLFGSEIKSLIQARELSREVDFTALRQYLSYLYAPAPYTPLQQVRKLEPGASLVVRRGKIVRQEFFYNLPYNGKTLKGSEADVTIALKGKLESAIQRQLMSDVPVGAFLSGGMDSSSIVALMRLAQPGTKFKCFTIGDGEKSDSHAPILNDLHYARLVAKEFHLDLSVVEVRPTDFNLLEKVIYHLDEPQADPAAINSFLICEKARHDGIKVLMSGAGGDDLFSGYPRHIAVETESVAQLLPSALRKLMAQASHYFSAPSGGTAFMRNERQRKICKVLSTLHQPQDRRLAAFYLNASADSISPLLGERFIEPSRSADILAPLLNSLQRIPEERNVLNRMLYLDTKHFLTDHNLNYIDKTSMASGVEVRVPLLDLEIIHLAAQINPKLKRRGFENKYIFKQAVKGLLPAEIYSRKKQGFGLPIRRWLNKELAPVMEETLSESSLRNRGFFNPRAVRQLVQLDRSRKIDATFALFSMMCFELWSRKFLDAQSLRA